MIPIYTIKEFLRISRYTRPCVYRVSYTIHATNDGGSSTSVSVGIPVPQKTASQEVDMLSFSEKVELQTDERYGNMFGIWNARIPANETRHLLVTCRVTVRPLHVSIRAARTTSRAYPPQMDPYREANRFIEPLLAEVAGLRKRLEQKNNAATIAAYNTYVVSRLTYGDPITSLYSASDALTLDRVDCGGFDVLLCSLCLAGGIPARIVSGFWAGKTYSNAMHAWCEIGLGDGRWLPADPSVEYLVKKGRDRTKSGRLGYVGSDRIIFGYGCDIAISNGEGGHLRLPILQHPFVIAQELPRVRLDVSYAATEI